MKIYGRKLIKNVALFIWHPLRPLFDAMGIDTKSLYEFLYWKSRQIEEGTLRNDWYVNLFIHYVGIPRDFYRGKKILDIGCGPRGSLEWADMAAERVGLDPLVPRYRALGIERHAMRYVDAPAERIPFPDDHFDVVSSINSLDHVDDVDAAIREMSRVLAPGGLLLLVVEIHPRPTIAEPHTLPWDLMHRLTPRLQVIEEHHFEWLDDGRHYLVAHVPFDHDDPRPRNGILFAKLRKSH